MFALARKYLFRDAGPLGGGPRLALLEKPKWASPPNCCCLCLFFRGAARCLALAREELGALRRRAGLPRSPLRGSYMQLRISRADGPHELHSPGREDLGQRSREARGIARMASKLCVKWRSRACESSSYRGEMTLRAWPAGRNGWLVSCTFSLIC